MSVIWIILGPILSRLPSLIRATHLRFLWPHHLVVSWLCSLWHVLSLSTEQEYTPSLSANLDIPIKVISVNDAAEISVPNTVLRYQKGIICRTSYQELSSLGSSCFIVQLLYDPRSVKLWFRFSGGTNCLTPGASKMPLGEDLLKVTGIDMDVTTPSCPATCGNMTLTFRYMQHLFLWFMLYHWPRYE